MKNVVVIGLFGAQIESINLGCQALTFSLLNVLQEISKRRNIEFEYKVFERFPNQNRFAVVSNLLDIPFEKLVSVKSARFLRIGSNNIKKLCKQEIQSCDLIIDLTLGDSFSDIYGFRRFISYTADKFVIENCRIPLILGPQTYGPYKNPLVKMIARKSINNSFAVFSRDADSTKCLRKLKVKKNVYTGTDLAFSLPYTKVIPDKNVKTVGINISGMLWSQNYDDGPLESGVVMRFKCDYQAFSLEIIKKLINRGYQVHLIPHVTKDLPAINEIASLYPENVINPGCFDDPISAKNYISGMNFFIGARMHSTIAAVSSGVPTIPVSYSRKFEGLYHTLGYKCCIDLHTVDTLTAVDYVLDFESHLDDYRKAVEHSKHIAQEISSKMIKALEDSICDILRLS